MAINFGFILIRLDAVESATFKPCSDASIGLEEFPRLRVGSSMVEQRPFKALVPGSSPGQPTL